MRITKKEKFNDFEFVYVIYFGIVYRRRMFFNDKEYKWLTEVGKVWQNSCEQLYLEQEYQKMLRINKLERILPMKYIKTIKFNKRLIMVEVKYNDIVYCRYNYSKDEINFENYVWFGYISNNKIDIIKKGIRLLEREYIKMLRINKLERILC